MVERLPSKQDTRVRFPSPALLASVGWLVTTTENGITLEELIQNANAALGLL